MNFRPYAYARTQQFLPSYGRQQSLTHSDIKSNPGPKRKISNYFSCCHWNMNIIMARNKFFLISAYNSLHKYDIIFILESYLDNTADDVLSIDGYNLLELTI